MSSQAVSVDIISLGCSKNLVDSERLIAMLRRSGVHARIIESLDTVSDPAEHIVINTCGFIGDAKQESVDTILEVVQAKSEGLIDSVNVMGCLSERYRAELPVEIPEVDRWYGKFDWTGLVSDLTATTAHGDTPGHDASGEPESTSPTEAPCVAPSSTYSAYIKVSEGCDRFCAFCTIPLITGRHHSRTVEDIVAEVTELTHQGVKEFNIIAQDLSSYGTDLANADGTTGTSQLARLLEALAAIEGVEWIRLHYAYPADFPYDILPVMARHANICKYLDIALQHASDSVLSGMRRHITAAETVSLIERIRSEVPGIHLRTTLMVGFPGEGDDEFDELMEFVATQRFERMGAFAYSEEEGTYAARHLEDSVSEEVKQQRLNRLMALQEQISLEHNQAKIGSVLRVLVDREEPEYYVARTEWDSPEVDPEVLITKQGCPKLVAGDFCHVTVTDALPYELEASFNSLSTQ